MNVDVAVLGSPSLIIRTVSVDVEQHLKEKKNEKGRSESAEDQRRKDCKLRWRGHSGLPVSNGPSISTVSVDVKQHLKKPKGRSESAEDPPPQSRGGRPGP